MLRPFIGGLAVVLLALVVGVATLRPRLASSQQKAPALPVEAGRPAPRVEKAHAGWVGVLIHEESIDLASRLDGRVESVKVQVGDAVRQGEVLVALDARNLREDLAIAEAELLSRKAELEVARLALEQSRERLARRESPEQLKLMAISVEELSAARYEHSMATARWEVARARVQESEARVEQLRQKVAEAQLRAPFDGVIAGRLVHPMQLVRSGQPLLHVLRRGRPQVRFAIPDQELGTLREGQPVRVEVAERGVAWEGRVTHLSPEVDVATLMVFALAELEPVEGSPVPTGTAVRVKVSSRPSRAENP